MPIGSLPLTGAVETCTPPHWLALIVTPVVMTVDRELTPLVTDVLMSMRGNLFARTGRAFTPPVDSMISSEVIATVDPERMEA